MESADTQDESSENAGERIESGNSSRISWGIYAATFGAALLLFYVLSPMFIAEAMAKARLHGTVVWETFDLLLTPLGFICDSVPLYKDYIDRTEDIARKIFR